MSEEVARGWKEKIELFWVDGRHDYEHVKMDFKAFSPFVINGGLIVLHDSFNTRFEGPARVVQEALNTRRFEKVNEVGCSTVLRKNKE